jgi:DNA polymerase (family X)
MKISISGAYAKHRFTRAEAEAVAKEIEVTLKIHSVRNVLAGSYRRGETDVGDLDFIVTDCTLEDLLSDLQEDLKVSKVARKGEKILTIVIKQGKKELQVEFINVPDKSFGAALLHSTGSGDFNMGMRSYAKRKGMLLNQYGLFQDERKIAGTTEESIFKKLGLQGIPPQHREDFWSIKDQFKL